MLSGGKDILRVEAAKNDHGNEAGNTNEDANHKDTYLDPVDLWWRSNPAQIIS